MKNRILGTFLLILCTMIWGMAFVAQSVGMDHIGPFTFQAVRCFLAVIGLLPVCVLTDRFKNDGKSFLERWSDKKLWKAGIFCGIPLFLACNLQQMGLIDTDAGKSAFLTAMYIVIVPVLGLFLKRKPSKMLLVCIALAVAGLYCLSCVGVTQINTGDLLLLGCAFAFAVQIIMVDLLGLDVDALRLNMIQALVCAALSAVLMLFAETPTWQSISQCWLPLAYAGFLSMGVAYYLQIMGQKFLEPSAASILLSMESVFAVIFGALFLHETMTSWERLGCVLMFAAVILSQVKFREKA
ncbi:MAG: DMT family transporter [Oscillospiraceae bacterium]|nr:DMT family transporter [Oscillospiraceae bacterium]